MPLPTATTSSYPGLEAAVRADDLVAVGVHLAADSCVDTDFQDIEAALLMAVRRRSVVIASVLLDRREKAGRRPAMPL